MYNKCFCKEPEKIENYEKAKADNFKGWHCHHRRGVDIPMEELIALGMYYNVSPDELIFLTSKEHNILHKKGKHFCEEHKQKISNSLRGKPKSEEHKKKIGEAHKGNTPWNKGKHHSEETKKKISEALIGEKHPMYGKQGINKGNKLSEETRRKMSEAHKSKTGPNKGKHFSEETKKKMSLQKTGRHWFNNGEVNKFCYECPEGFVPGKLR